MQQAASKPVRDPDVEVTASGDGTRVVHLSGAWDIRALESHARALQSSLAAAGPVNAASWDLSQIQRFDHIGAMLLWRAWGKCRPMKLELRREHEIFFGDCEASVDGAPAQRRRDPLAPVIALGRGVIGAVEHAVQMVQLFGQLLLDAAAIVPRPRLRPWREFSAGIYAIGAQALGITALVGFLIGVVLSYLSAEQLRLVGADIFIVNILGVGIVGELAPVVCLSLVGGGLVWGVA